MRTLKHPGPVFEPRRVVKRIDAGEQFVITLDDGDLLDGIRDTLIEKGINSAGIRLLASELEGFGYMTAMPDPSGDRVATYRDPILLVGPVTLVSGDAHLGAGPDGEPMIHCHAVFVDQHGNTLGGHVLSGKARVKNATAIVTALAGAGFAVGRDDETNFSIFQVTGEAA